MVKSKDNVKSNNPTKGPKREKREGGEGLDEIDSLFADKKRSRKDLQEQIVKEEEMAKRERTRRNKARLDEEADDVALRGASATCVAVGSRKGDAAAPASLYARARTLPSLTYTRADAEQLRTPKNAEGKGAWAADGLGGVFNGEGFTGRRDDAGHRVFKAHLMNEKGFGNTPDCPFDCNCCFI